MKDGDAERATTIADEVLRLTTEVASVRTPLAQSASAVAGVLGTLRESDAFLALLRVRATDIGKISLLIEHIASESRLLALNAKILAAQAGHSGAGFTIVAERMMALADHTRQSATGIQEAVDSLKRDTELAATRVSDGVKQVEDAVTLADSASDALHAVYDASKRLSRVSRRTKS